MTEINNKLLALFEGKCWHDTDDCTVACKHCGEWIWETPNYTTSPADRERLLQYLMGQREMHPIFYWYGWDKYTESYRSLEGYASFQEDYSRWFFLPPPDSDIPRWLLLLQEWLELEEVKEKFGVVYCKDYKSLRCDHCSDCDGTGKVEAKWAKEG